MQRHFWRTAAPLHDGSVGKQETYPVSGVIGKGCVEDCFVQRVLPLSLSLSPPINVPTLKEIVHRYDAYAEVASDLGCWFTIHVSMNSSIPLLIRESWRGSSISARDSPEFEDFVDGCMTYTEIIGDSRARFTIDVLADNSVPLPWRKSSHTSFIPKVASGVNLKPENAAINLKHLASVRREVTPVDTGSLPLEKISGGKSSG
jgi:hypothetical protein